MHVLILGCRGVPARHGGFETFAEDLARYLTARNHEVTVYCQAAPGGPIKIDRWEEIRRIHIPAPEGALGTILFDLAAVRHSSHERGVVLTLGYNTGVLNFLYRLRRIPNLMNMDGIEWKRQKWSKLQRAWLWASEWAGARAATHLIADHPEIQKHLTRHTRQDKITMIPYGAHSLNSGPVGLIQKYGLRPDHYFILIARPEPENSVLEIVEAYSAKTREIPLVVLGRYEPDKYPYHQRVIDAAGSEVKFLGAIYDQEIVRSLRFHARAYLHGHRVGGTNPSLVESLAAGNAVIAHDNRFTRWVAGDSARFFQGASDLTEILDTLEREPTLLEHMRQGSRMRHQEFFTQEKVLLAYEQLLLRHAPVAENDRELVARANWP
jgi:glycosyltransferase involved in cell wall biosynthesis